VFDATPDAHRHLLRSPGNVIVVDGYNLARAAWSDLSTEEERRRTVALLEDVQARSGGRVVVVFDGETGVVAPIASKHVVVRFSETGQTADDLIADLVQGIPVTDPVVVVSSDRAVADRARSDGAVVIASQALLAAVRS
jgi:predicted RNA-binding protein with PIN domain